MARSFQTRTMLLEAAAWALILAPPINKEISQNVFRLARSASLLFRSNVFIDCRIINFLPRYSADRLNGWIEGDDSRFLAPSRQFRGEKLKTRGEMQRFGNQRGPLVSLVSLGDATERRSSAEYGHLLRLSVLSRLGRKGIATPSGFDCATGTPWNLCHRAQAWSDKPRMAHTISRAKNKPKTR